MRVMRTLLRHLGLLSPRRCPGIPVSVDKFLHIIHIFETPDTDHREGLETVAHGLEKDTASVDLDCGDDKIIHIFETPDTDHREVEELSSLLAQPATDAPHGIEQLSGLPFETGEPLVPDRTSYLQAEVSHYLPNIGQLVLLLLLQGLEIRAHGLEKDAANIDLDCGHDRFR
ncbi:hypothetical protein CDL15_Pgr012523 [Punica granatum]|uniref:Uncharacterized protein n=1 Tax=Punica granatum TaxID=22663 RepID=A0A218XZ19_PUNGR|nr:hypothetical protein CDL15_Pgr012523 [Punica granatum]